MQYLNWTFSKYEKKYNGDYVIDFSKDINNDLLSNPNNIVRYIDTSIITSPFLIGNHILPTTQKLFAPLKSWSESLSNPFDFMEAYVKVTNNQATILQETNALVENSVKFLESGTAEIIYEVVFVGFAKGPAGFTAKVLIYTTANINPLPPWNARTVIDRLLRKAETLRASQQPRFHLNAEQAAEFEKIEMPELHLTNSTLREALQTVGSYVHGEPRLRGDEISFDMYGGNEKNEVDLSKYAQKTYQQSIDSAITSVDSTVDNLVSTMGYAKGVIVEPYEKGFKTLRTETVYARITEDNMLIETSYPINRIEKLECGVIKSKDGSKSCGELDITPYVFEESEYTRLSSYSDLFPDSRAYAIYYTQGEKNIKGLNFKQVSVYQSLKNYAILNIINAVAGNVFDAGDFDYRLLAFRVTYESITSARVKQSKQCINDFTRKSEIAYNQGQNLIESSYYGEHLKGVAARLGNVDKVITIIQRGKPNIPKVGTLYDDDYYISAVAVEYQPYHTKISCALSKDFNRYSDYVGINSTRRFYEISERQAYDSFINYRDYVVIGDSFTPDSSLPAPMLRGIAFVQGAFVPTDEVKDVTDKVNVTISDDNKTATFQATGVSGSVVLTAEIKYGSIMGGSTTTTTFTATLNSDNAFTADFTVVGSNEIKETPSYTATQYVGQTGISLVKAQGFMKNESNIDVSGNILTEISEKTTITFKGNNLSGTVNVKASIIIEHLTSGRNESRIIIEELTVENGYTASYTVGSTNEQIIGINYVEATQLSGYVALNTVILPVKAMSMGNAAIFTFKYKDNYSAGDNANYREETDDKGNPVEYLYQNSVQYKDYYGRMEYLRLDYYKRGTAPGGWTSQYKIGNALPDTNASDTITIDGDRSLAISTGDDYLWLDVGATEIPTFTYQLEFVTNRRTIIVGSALARNLPLVGNRFGGEHAAKLYVLPGRLNKFSKMVELTGATVICENKDLFKSFEDYKMTFKPFTSTVAGESWAMVDGATGELLIGENKEITGDGVTDILNGLTVTLTHEVI